MFEADLKYRTMQGQAVNESEERKQFRENQEKKKAEAAKKAAKNWKWNEKRKEERAKAKAAAEAKKAAGTEPVLKSSESSSESEADSPVKAPYDETKKLRLVIDGASSVGVGFVLFQFLSDQEPAKGAVIINANSSLLGENQVGYSPIDAEMISLDFASRACHYWLWCCPEIELYSDCSGMLDMLQKPIADIENRRHQKILTRLMNYNFSGNHIAGVDQKIADALSRL